MAWSDEVNGLIRAVHEAPNVPYRITSVCRSGPWSESHHNRPGTNGCGQAVDFAGPTAFNEPRPHPPLYAIFEALLPYENQLAELIYSGADFYIKNGERRPISNLRRSTYDAHWNHVHSAVHLGVVLDTGTISPMPPNVYPAQAPVVNLVPTPTGNGYWIITAKGETFAFGDAVYHGGVEVVQSAHWWNR